MIALDSCMTLYSISQVIIYTQLRSRQGLDINVNQVNMEYYSQLF